MRLVNTGNISVNRTGGGVSIAYAGEEFISDLGIGLPIKGSWSWTFDRSLKLLDEREGSGRDRLGEYSYVALTYTMPDAEGEDAPHIPHIRQQIKAYAGSRLLVETSVLEDITGAYLEDSFYNTTFNSPVLLFPKDFNFLAYTLGLMATESSRDVGHFPEAITGRGVSDIPSKLLMAGFAPREDLHTTSEKPFAPLAVYDDEGRTLVVSPFNHLLISPLRVIETPSGMGVARGLHGSIDTLPRGTTTSTALVFGEGVTETMTRWGDWLLEAGGKERAAPVDNPLVGSIGFWNCFGGYYTELFRQVDEKTLQELAAYFKDGEIPARYFGLDLWYNYDHVGFARNYTPDAGKYPRGLGPVHQETGVPYLLHMSAFESPNDYIGRHEFAVDRSSAYPLEREFYAGLARDFKESGAFGIWPDFLRTQLQNSRSMKNGIGNADRWFDNLSGAFGDEGMVMMMCMPTTGHYMASARHRNIIAVRTHSDYMNHQTNQVENLRVTGQVRNFLPLQQSIRHNVLLSLLAHSLALCPSFDVFLTNGDHPEGFAEPNAEYEALLRAMSAGVVAIGDKAGFIDVEIVKKLCFPDGRTSRPDHPPFPVVSTLQSDVLAFYTTATVGAFRWVYLAAFNVGDGNAHYELDLRELCGRRDPAVYDYFSPRMGHASVLEGDLEPARGHYYVIPPQVGDLYLLGFPDKYITASGRQVAGVDINSTGEVAVNLRLPFSSSALSSSDNGPPSARGLYTLAIYTPPGLDELDVRAEGAEIGRVSSQSGLLHVEFAAKSEAPSLHFRRRNGPP
jgi:hypothetical protein